MKSYSEFYNKRYKFSQVYNNNEASNIRDENINNSENDNNFSTSTDEDLNRSITSPPVAANNNKQVNNISAPLGSISNRLNNFKQTNTLQANNCTEASYNLYSNYENYPNFQNHFAPFHQSNQNFHQNNYITHSNQQNNVHFPFYSPNHYQFQNNSLRLNNHHRTSTGSTSADSSSLSLNSPPINKDENIPPLNGTNLNSQSHHTQQQESLNSFGNTVNNISVSKNLSNAQLNEIKRQEVSNLTPINSTSSRANVSILNSSMSSNNEDSLPIKKRRPVPAEQKDSQYWDKRRKNNESAKRSRDIRRSKEEHISIRVIYLEQENLQLRTECALLRSETEKLRSMLYSTNNNNNIQNNNC